ncbi:hypothetical protein P7K49_024515 [Saguinus oedipus]|uniref:Uncharacterized protein n=1 Tax=Saguinus oedipus TaxID=9490 RepID=A0ABQ9UPR2_SAGOE|nr:hypothetical protein P7K49_024515 [Saguinus oedipus]
MPLSKGKISHNVWNKSPYGTLLKGATLGPEDPRHWARPKQHQARSPESPPSRRRRAPSVATATREALTPDLEAPPLRVPDTNMEKANPEVPRQPPAGC